MEARSLFRLSAAFKGCLRVSRPLRCHSRRQLSSSPRTSADTPTAPTASTAPTEGGLGGIGNWTKQFDQSQPDQNNHPNEYPRDNEHHLHCFATKHNCHLTLSSPTFMKYGKARRKTIITLSSGNIGFRKSARGTYDAAYQLGSYMMSRIQDRGLLKEIRQLELVFRGYGPGRDAIGKIMTGVEGNKLRPKVIRVVDATRLKFGGTRSRKPRRLG